MKATKPARKIFVIGLDACDSQLLNRWVEDGSLPFLSDLMQKSAFLKLRSEADLFVPSPWMRLTRGISAAEDGFYSPQQLKRGSLQVRRPNLRALPLPFWSHLRGSQRKFAFFDVPRTVLADGLAGIQVCDWATSYPLQSPVSHPRDLLNTLNQRFGRPGLKALLTQNSVDEALQARRSYLQSVERKCKAVRFLLEQEDWDFFFTVFSESHYAADSFLHLADPGHWAYDAQEAARLGNPVKEVYRRLDQALAELFEMIPKDATCFIVSVHGCRTNYSGNHLLPHVLQALGYQASSLAPLPTNGKVNGALGERKPDGLPEILNRRILPQSFRHKLVSRRYFRHIDWSKTEAFCLPGGNFNGLVSVNLKGREPYGTVEPGREYEDVCARLGYDLMSLINPATGRPAVRRVVQTRWEFEGARVSVLPDLFIEWAEDGPIDAVQHRRFGVLHKAMGAIDKNKHTPEGFLLANGPDVIRDKKLMQANILDFAPTLLTLLGANVPSYMPGKVLYDLFKQKQRAKTSLEAATS